VTVCTARVAMAARCGVGNATHDREHDAVARARCTRGSGSGTHVHLLC
jgi:hypothetical protein